MKRERGKFKRNRKLGKRRKHKKKGETQGKIRKSNLVRYLALKNLLNFLFVLQGESVTTAVLYSRDTGSNPVGFLITPREKRTAHKHALQVNQGENRP